jgi:hypothetical protein
VVWFTVKEYDTEGKEAKRIGIGIGNKPKQKK